MSGRFFLQPPFKSLWPRAVSLWLRLLDTPLPPQPTGNRILWRS
jgi:hypothetical protein